MPLSSDEVFVPFRLVDGEGDYAFFARCTGCEEELSYDYRGDKWEAHTVTDCLKVIRKGGNDASR